MGRSWEESFGKVRSGGQAGGKCRVSIPYCRKNQAGRTRSMALCEKKGCCPLNTETGKIYSNLRESITATALCGGNLIT
jgi:hypothetical protein